MQVAAVGSLSIDRLSSTPPLMMMLILGCKAWNPRSGARLEEVMNLTRRRRSPPEKDVTAIQKVLMTGCSS